MLRIPGWVNDQPVPSDLYNYTATHKPAVEITVNGRAKEYRMEKAMLFCRKIGNRVMSLK